MIKNIIGSNTFISKVEPRKGKNGEATQQKCEDLGASEAIFFQGQLYSLLINIKELVAIKIFEDVNKIYANSSIDSIITDLHTINGRQKIPGQYKIKSVIFISVYNIFSKPLKRYTWYEENIKILKDEIFIKPSQLFD